jgi:hypothetical protein
MKTTTQKKRSPLAVGAAVLGILAGASLGGCGKTDDKAKAEANGCGGPNGCGGKTEHKKESNGCGANGCSAKAEGKKEANGCGGHNGCKGETKKNG